MTCGGCSSYRKEQHGGHLPTYTAHSLGGLRHITRHSQVTRLEWGREGMGEGGEGNMKKVPIAGMGEGGEGTIKKVPIAGKESGN
jgi:hypothetical protein